MLSNYFANSLHIPSFRLATNAAWDQEQLNHSNQIGILEQP